MPKIYIINKGGHDFTRAAEFGELCYLSEGTQNPFQVNDMYRKMAETVEASHSDDFILSTGLPIMRQVFSAMFAWKHGKLNLLLFKDDKYIARHIVLNSLITKADKEQ